MTLSHNDAAGNRDHPRILVVEDDDIQAQVLDSVLSEAGFEVETVSNGLDAVWKAREGRHDAIVVDYQLPEIDGLAAAKLVGDLMGPAARPVLIALTATPEDLKERENGAQSAFDAVLGKSNDLSALVAVITARLASAPGKPARQDAEAMVLRQAWLDYETPRAGANGDDSAPARILVVEDDEAQRTMLTGLFEAQGYVVAAASDGLEAVRKIRVDGYDLALVDYNMPEIDGLAAGKLIRNLMRESVRPRLIAFTATPDRLRDTESGTLSVFDEIIGKSPDFSGLLAAVDRHLKCAPNPTT
jgi:CheY-like chemotaxis protein